MGKTDPLCQLDGCDQPAAWEIPNYFNKGSAAERNLGTRHLYRCEVHGKEHRAMNPFQDWRQMASTRS